MYAGGIKTENFGNVNKKEPETQLTAFLLALL